MKNRAYLYAEDVVNKKVDAPKYVIKQCQIFLDISDGKDKEYIVDENKVELIENILKMLVMPKGLQAGKSLFETSCGYQWLFYIAVLCTVKRDNKDKRKYEKAVLEIARKNFKTFTVATMFIILFLLEPKFSKFYSVAPDGSLSREVKSAIEEILKSSPDIYAWQETPRFKITRDVIKFLPKDSSYFPLNYSNSRMDGKLPNVFLADEVGALPNSYAIESMQSGQLSILNKLGCIISTKYPRSDNPFEDEVRYARNVLDNVIDDKAVFALLYEPDDNIKDFWVDNDRVLKQANPVAIEIPTIWDDLIKKRSRAINMDSAKENFLTKHCNIIYQGVGTESYVDIRDVQKCKTDHIDWTGREVYLGVDLSMSNDNCAVSMVSRADNGDILAQSIAFIPEGRIEEKSRRERVDYKGLVLSKNCIACGNKTIDYSVIEDYVLTLEDRLKVKILGIGFDRYNAMSSAQKWDEFYPTVEIRQHSSTLHSPTKLLYEKIVNKEFKYTENQLLEINFQNARCVYDTNLNRYVNKKKSNGKIDIVAAMINAMYLLEQDSLRYDGDFLIQF